MGSAAIVVGDVECRIERNGLVIVGDGSLVVLLRLVGVAPIDIDNGILGIEFNRLVVVGNGSIVVPIVKVSIAAAVVCSRFFWVSMPDGMSVLQALCGSDECQA